MKQEKIKVGEHKNISAFKKLNIWVKIPIFVVLFFVLSIIVYLLISQYLHDAHIASLKSSNAVPYKNSVVYYAMTYKDFLAKGLPANIIRDLNENDICACVYTNDRGSIIIALFTKEKLIIDNPEHLAKLIRMSSAVMFDFNKELIVNMQDAGISINGIKAPVDASREAFIESPLIYNITDYTSDEHLKAINKTIYERIREYFFGIQNTNVYEIDVIYIVDNKVYYLDDCIRKPIITKELLETANQFKTRINDSNTYVEELNKRIKTEGPNYIQLIRKCIENSQKDIDSINAKFPKK